MPQAKPLSLASTPAMLAPMRILLVEDDKQTADYIAKGLREHGHVVDHANNGRDGLYLATGEKYDVMIVDRMLPGMDGLALLEKINRAHQATRAEDTRLDARIKSYEMAARLQLSAPEVLSIDGETDATKKLYGLDDPLTEEMGRRCLVARRLLERGVRFVQLWSGADNGFPRRNWDSHEHLAKDHWEMAVAIDKPIAALMKDLKARGLFDDTIVHWTTEFGRMPCSQGSKGRDHNPFGYTNWLAGGGVKGGASYGATDEWSYKAVDKPCYGYDVHATMLHLLGIDHKRLSYRHNGIDRRLTDVHGNVLREIVA